ncbi:rab11 family-interacting protein 4-like isoform X3 [Ptychodera flava]|uniref:rab11 family-interacting protein 4-like isoform X3 n=1 Tax=Ptychodera flava TaxID=63121 RepID=UPI00396A4BAA
METDPDLDRQLKIAFEAFDEAKRGFISSEHFVNIAQQYFNVTYAKKERINAILHHLDPQKTGRISFRRFCQGVKTILKEIEGANQYHAQASSLSSYHSNPFPEDLIIFDDDSNSCGTCETSESTFNEYDELGNDDSVMTDATDEDAIPNFLIAGTDDTDSALTPSPTNSTMNSYCNIRKSTSDEEERYEDFGEGNDMDGDDSDTDIPDYLSDSNRLSPSTPTPTQNLSISFDNRKTITQKRDVWGRVRQLSCSKCKSRLYVGPVRRLTTKEIASHLYKNSSSATNSRRGSLEDVYGECAASDGDVTDLNDKVKKLESQVHTLREDKANKHDLHSKLTNENAFLKEKTKFYEEQMGDLEVKSQEALERERRKHREAMLRLEEEARRETEHLAQTVATLEGETSRLKIDHTHLKAGIEKLKEENRRLQIDLIDKDDEVKKVTQEYRRYQEQWRNERGSMREEIEANATLVVEMSKELEDLRRYKAEQKSIGRFRASDLPSRCAELESEIKTLRQENIALKETNDELNAQVIHSSVQLGRSLLEIGPCKSDSFAAEIETASKDEIMNALKEQESLNRDLKEYIDRILVRILENNPSLLERK